MVSTAAPAPRRRVSPWTAFRPKLIDALREGYGFSSLRADVLAGLTVAIVALPLAMALAIASGATPEKGLLTALLAGGLISALSGSRFQIGGPTGAFVVVVFNVIARFGFDGLVLATLMAGALLLAAGFARLGAWIKYIPEPVVAGFTAGIGIVIATSQIRDLLGLSMSHVPADFLAKWVAMWGARASVAPWALVIAAGSLAVIVVLRRWAPKAPGFLIAAVMATLAVVFLHLPVETIGSRFGHLDFGLPAPHIPSVSWERVKQLTPTAFTIAFLAGVESLLSAVVADGMTGRLHRPNAELVAQGVANLASALFGGLPATGAVARTATNVRAGARSPVAGVVHAMFVGLFMLVGGPLAVHVPLAALAAILVMVAWGMSEPHKLMRLLRAPMGDRVVLLATLSLTVLVDLTVAIGVGVVLAAMIFMHHMAESASLSEGSVVDEDDDLAEPADQRDGLPPGVVVFQLRGPLFFGAATRFTELLLTISSPPRAIILRMSRTAVVDATGVGVLRDFVRRCRHDGVRVILSGVREQPLHVLASMGLGPGGGEVEYAENFAGAVALTRSSPVS
ncbi:MAG TPA: SulP family inorganic anion transporter [Caulobacteraceae bacterium]|nr:SulP family inorganic anion transporter [Caulobacteraceae bacterium]